MTSEERRLHLCSEPPSRLSQHAARQLALLLTGQDSDGWSYRARTGELGAWHVEVLDEQGHRLGDL